MCIYVHTYIYKSPMAYNNTTISLHCIRVITSVKCHTFAGVCIQIAGLKRM